MTIDSWSARKPTSTCRPPTGSHSYSVVVTERSSAGSGLHLAEGDGGQHEGGRTGRGAPANRPAARPDARPNTRMIRKPARGTAGISQMVSSTTVQPRNIERSSALAPGLRRRMATMMPRPTTTSAAATTSTKNTAVCPLMSSRPDGQGHEGEVDRVEHELDAHEHHQRVAPDEQAHGAHREEDGGQQQVPGRAWGPPRPASSRAHLLLRPRPAGLPVRRRAGSILNGRRARTTVARTATTSRIDVTSNANT